MQKVVDYRIIEQRTAGLYTASKGDVTTHTLTMAYDYLRRLTSVQNGSIYTRNYTYKNLSSTQTTTQVSKVAYTGLDENIYFNYTYDDRGNIKTYTDIGGSGLTESYTYDAQGQLLSSTDGWDTDYYYTYDDVGNILTVRIEPQYNSADPITHTYAYSTGDWKDLLVSYDGHTITYDGAGNPLTYYNGADWTFTWSNGRRLASATDADGTTHSYYYDMDGSRRKKIVDGVTHSYLWYDGKPVKESYTGNTMFFLYDQDGRPFVLIHNSTVYYYITNLQGDETQLVDASGATVASYEYDPYGNITYSSGSMAEINPLRYRGYYYDSETGLYYLNSRYYDPATGRFLNADSYASTGQGALGYNMFAYCNNNSISYSDNSGLRMEYANADLIGGYLGFSTAGFDPNGSFSPGSRRINVPDLSNFSLLREEIGITNGTKIAEILTGGFDAYSFGDGGFNLLSFNVSALSLDVERENLLIYLRFYQ